MGGDHGAAMRAEQDEAALGQPLDGLPDGMAADVQLRGEPNLVEPFPGGKLAGQDHPLDLGSRVIRRALEPYRPCHAEISGFRRGRQPSAIMDPIMLGACAALVQNGQRPVGRRFSARHFEPPSGFQ
jgi:hypothetical protein